MSASTSVFENIEREPFENSLPMSTTSTGGRGLRLGRSGNTTWRQLRNGLAPSSQLASVSMLGVAEPSTSAAFLTSHILSATSRAL